MGLVCYLAGLVLMSFEIITQWRVTCDYPECSESITLPVYGLIEPTVLIKSFGWLSYKDDRLMEERALCPVHKTGEYSQETT